MRVAWDSRQVRSSGGIVDVVLDDEGEPAKPGGGHAMLAVGYDAEKRHIIVKNSWGAGWGDGGYCYVTEDYLEVYARHGFWVKRVRVHEDATAENAAVHMAAVTAAGNAARVGLVPGVNLRLLGR